MPRKSGWISIRSPPAARRSPQPCAPSAGKRPMRATLAFHRKLPGYAPTPLVDARNAARELLLSRLWVKDESRRLDLAAYKILGASWAVFRALDERFGPFDEWSTLDALSPRIERQGPLELVAASEGNHGRAGARIA